MKKMLVCFVSFFFIFSVSFNFLTSLTRLLRDNCKARLMLSGSEKDFKVKTKNAFKNKDYSYFYHILKALRQPQQAMDESMNWRIISKLENEDSVLNLSKKKSVVYIPRSSKWFWASALGDCSSLPFVVPAITGLAALRGGPALSCKRTVLCYGTFGYGNEGYNLLRSELLLDLQKKDATCREITKLGFSRVITFDFSGDGQITRRFMDC